ncbi:MFS transporter [Diaminobutyricimonas sp. TR449]|uniref:MFS transporter n=1 Tax=Diaminobutyricimonas sp. TR449 TaxID=2708076 RepID=UPI00141DF075|nr:MFS transporter [Diaminobutyricimonas sp. TR449]
MTEHEPEGPVPRNAWGLLLSRGFGAFFAARLATSIGTWLHSVVAAIAAFDATGSALVVGLVSAAQFLPQIIFGPLAGVWTDQGSIKFQMMLGRSLLSSGSLALALWYFFFNNGDSAADAVAIAASSLVFGIGLVIGGPALQTAAPLLVTRAELPAAMALNTAPMTIGRIAGPVVGALGIAWLGYGMAFLIGGLFSVVFIVLIASINFPTVEGHRRGEKHSMREALAFVIRDRPALLTLIGVTAVGLGSEPVVTLAPALSAEFGGDSHTVGALVTAVGVGAGIGVLLSSILALRTRQDHASFVGMLIMAISLGVCGFALPELWVMIAFGASGFGFIVAQTGLSTILQLRLPPLLRGRVMALWLIGFVGSRPLGAVFVGAVTDASSVYIAFAVVGVLMLIAALICRPKHLREPDLV